MTSPPPPDNVSYLNPGRNVIALNWDQVERWLTGKLRAVARPEGRIFLPPPWEPGNHWALVGPTGEGKSTLAVALLKIRKYVLALDPKGEDETLAASGYQRVGDVPPRRVGWFWTTPNWPRDIQRRLDSDAPVRLIVGLRARTDSEDVALQKLLRKAIEYCRVSGGWTLYVDEFELLSSQRMFKMGPLIERMLITARRAKTSVLTSFQAAAWVSKHATRQATFAVIFPTRDRAMIKAVAESFGRDWRIIAQIVDELPPFHCLIIHKSIRAPMIITKAPKAA